MMLLDKAPGRDGGPVSRWLVLVIAVSAVILLPWAGYLAVSLPASVSARHWPLAWAGLDGAEAVGLAATAWLAARHGRRAAFPAVVTATLLLADAWFDVCTAPAGGPLAMALAGLGLEIAEAAGCLAIAVVAWRAVPCGPGPQRRSSQRPGAWRPGAQVPVLRGSAR